MHGHTAVLFNAAEMLDGPSRRLTQEREGHDEFAGPPGVLWVVAKLVVLQGAVENVLESLDRLQVFDLHGVYTWRVTSDNEDQRSRPGLEPKTDWTICNKSSVGIIAFFFQKI